MALSVADAASRRSAPWRYQARCPAESGLSSRFLPFRIRPAIAQPARLSDYNRCRPAAADFRTWRRHSACAPGATVSSRASGYPNARSSAHSGASEGSAFELGISEWILSAWISQPTCAHRAKASSPRTSTNGMRFSRPTKSSFAALKNSSGAFAR